MEVKETEVLAKYPNAKLHEIDKNRICITLAQLNTILNIDKDFHSYFLGLCENKLKIKRNKSLDFYDMFNILNEVSKKQNIANANEEKSLENQNEINESAFSFKNEINKALLEKEKKEKMMEGFKKEIKNKLKEDKMRMDIKNIEEKMKKLEGRLKLVENQMKSLIDAKK